MKGAETGAGGRGGGKRTPHRGLHLALLKPCNLATLWLLFKVLTKQAARSAGEAGMVYVSPSGTRMWLLLLAGANSCSQYGSDVQRQRARLPMWGARRGSHQQHRQQSRAPVLALR